MRWRSCGVRRTAGPVPDRVPRRRSPQPQTLQRRASPSRGVRSSPPQVSRRGLLPRACGAGPFRRLPHGPARTPRHSWKLRTLGKHYAREGFPSGAAVIYRARTSSSTRMGRSASYASRWSWGNGYGRCSESSEPFTSRREPQGRESSWWLSSPCEVLMRQACTRSSDRAYVWLGSKACRRDW